MNKEKQNDILVYFGLPAKLENHPDIRKEVIESRPDIDSSFVGLCSKAYVLGCKTCQHLASKCRCATKSIGELLVYDRGVGVQKSVFEMFQYRDTLSENDIVDLLPQDTEHASGNRHQEKFEMVEEINPHFIAAMRSYKQAHGREPILLYLSFPESEREDLKEFFARFQRTFPSDAESIHTGSRNGKTERRAASMTVNLPVPDPTETWSADYTEDSIQLSHPDFANGRVRGSDIRFGLKIFIEYPELCRLDYLRRE